MIGRATIGRPWLAGAVAKAIETNQSIVVPSVQLQKQAALAHYNDMIDLYGAPLGVRMARKHLAGYVEHAPIDASAAERRAFRSVICQIATPERVVEALEAFFDHGPQLASKFAA